MIDAIITLALLASVILLDFLCEWLVRGGRRVDKGLAVMRAMNDAQIQAIVDRVNRDAEQRAVEYREVRQ